MMVGADRSLNRILLISGSTILAVSTTQSLVGTLPANDTEILPLWALGHGAVDIEEFSLSDTVHPLLVGFNTNVDVATSVEHPAARRIRDMDVLRCTEKSISPLENLLGFLVEDDEDPCSGSSKPGFVSSGSPQRLMSSKTSAIPSEVPELIKYWSAGNSVLSISDDYGFTSLVLKLIKRKIIFIHHYGPEGPRMKILQQWFIIFLSYRLLVFFLHNIFNHLSIYPFARIIVKKYLF